MKSKQICAIALLVITLSSLYAFTPAPVVAAADDSLFKITIVAPGGANLLRRQWGLIIANSYQSVGIDAKVVFLGWDVVDERIMVVSDRSLLGKTWDQGGFDCLLVGWTPGAPTSEFAGINQLYSSANIPPNSNYPLWNNSLSDQLIGEFLTKGYTADGITAFKNWQAVFFDDMPASQIFWQKAIMTASNNLNFNGYEWIFDNLGPVPHFLSGGTDVTLASTGQPLDLCPPISNDWYSTIVYNDVFNGLIQYNQTIQMNPDLAISWTVSPDNRIYTFILRNDVFWHDGIEFTSDDVVFSYLATLNPQSGAKLSGTYSSYVGDDVTFTWLNGTSTRLVIDSETATGYYPATNQTGTRPAMIKALNATAVEFTIADFADLGQPVATFIPEGIISYISPKHVLENIPFADWGTHTFNTGVGTYTSNGQTFNGPIGTGPYTFKGWDPARQLMTLQKNNNYYDKAALEAAGQFTVQNYYVRYIDGKDAAIAALKNNEVQILDQNYQLQRDYQAGNLAFATSYELAGSGNQQLGFNMQHPVFGTGVDTPNGKTDPANAATYAKYVRQALDTLIPKELICTNLLGGLADPGAVYCQTISPNYNTSITYRAYDAAAARALLTLAGYDVGVTPGGPTALSYYLLGETITLSGLFSIDPVAAVEEGGIVAVLERSTDGTTWTPVAQTITTTGGYYSLSDTPSNTGNYSYRVQLTGVGANTAAISTATGPDFPYTSITQAIDPQTTDPVTITVASVDTAITTYRNQVTTLNTQVSALNAQIANLQNLAYAGIGIAIVAILIAVVLGMRKK